MLALGAASAYRVAAHVAMSFGCRVARWQLDNFAALVTGYCIRPY